VILMFLSLSIVYLGGLVDGTVAGGTGALRAQPTALLVFSDQSQLSFADSRIDADRREEIATLPGVTAVGALGVTQLGARLEDPDSRDLVDVAVFGYELGSNRLPDPPEDGTVYADTSLRTQGYDEGMTILVGPARTPLTVVGFVSDTAFDGQGTLWASADTWRQVQNANRPSKAVGTTSQQVLAVDADTDDVEAIRQAIDALGGLRAVSPTGAVEGLPGVVGTQNVFTAIIVLTTLVAAAVIALLFALLVIERVPLYGVLKALGVTSRSLFATLASQAAILALAATIAGTILGVAFGSIATSGPSSFVLTPSRALVSGALVIGASLLGAAVTLRRVLRIDPASAIGSAS
jgi:hemin transport system permease protein